MKVYMISLRSFNKVWWKNKNTYKYMKSDQVKHPDIKVSDWSLMWYNFQLTIALLFLEQSTYCYCCLQKKLLRSEAKSSCSVTRARFHLCSSISWVHPPTIHQTTKAPSKQLELFKIALMASIRINIEAMLIFYLNCIGNPQDIKDVIDRIF